MTHARLARDLLSTFASQWRVMAAVLPGVVLTLLQSTALDLPRADVIDALDSDHYRFEWVMAAYTLGGALGMAFTRFIANRVGLRIAFVTGVALFAMASCGVGLATSVTAMTPCRFAEGFGMGLTIAAAMVIIWRTFPIHKELAMAIYGMSIYLPSILGATLGGLLTAGLSWRLIFLLNLPLAAGIALAAAQLLPEDRQQRGATSRFDWIGVTLLIFCIVSLSVMLDLGQYWGWFSSRFFAPWFVLGFAAITSFLLWGVYAEHPLINLRPLALRSFGLGLGIKVAYSVNLYVMIALLANYMINLRAYQWWQGALVILSALGTMLVTLVIGTIIGNDANRKPRMFLGLAIMAFVTWQFGHNDVYTAKTLQAGWLALWGVGAGLVCGPALLTTFEGLSNEQTLDTAGIFNIARSLPAYVIGGLLVTLVVRHTDENFDWLRLNIRDNRPIVAETLHHSTSHMIAQGSSREAAPHQAHALLTGWLHANAQAYAMQDAFRLLALAPCVGLVLVLAVRVGNKPPS